LLGAAGAFSSESLPGLDPGWKPVRVKKTRQIKYPRCGIQGAALDRLPPAPR
jgi:hypothetical protein